MASIAKRPDGQWQARYRVTPGGRQYSKTTRRKVDAQRWLDERTTAVQTGMHVDPKTARMTVEQWCFDVARRVRDAAGVDRAAGAGARSPDRRGVRRHAAVGGAAVACEGVDREAHRRRARAQLRVRAACAAGTDPGRRGARRDHAALAVLEADLAGAGQAAAVRGDHGAGVGVARRDARPLPGRGAARRVRRSADRRRRAACGSPTWTSCAGSSRRPSSTRPSR